MKNKELIGLVGSKESTEKVLKILHKNFGLPQSSAVGNVYEYALNIISPNDFKGLVSETTIRQMANKVGANISVTKYAGKPVASEKEQSDYLVELANKHATKGWAAKLFVDTDFFRKKPGRYVALITRQEDSDFLAKDLGVDYKPVKVYDRVEDKSENENEVYIVVGGSAGKELNERISKAFFKLENKEKGAK